IWSPTGWTRTTSRTSVIRTWSVTVWRRKRSRTTRTGRMRRGWIGGGSRDRPPTERHRPRPRRTCGPSRRLPLAARPGRRDPRIPRRRHRPRSGGYRRRDPPRDPHPPQLEGTIMRLLERTSRDDWLAQRRDYITATDVAYLYTSPAKWAAIRAEKNGDVSDRRSSPEMQWGIDREAA